ncbi:MAG: hypothetical protein Q9222_002783 [Ikaeria aurantiellina]
MPRPRRQPKEKTRAARLPLPQCDGPKLHPFDDDTARLEFIRILSDTSIDADAYVFEVSIGGQPFALKVVRLNLSSAPSCCKLIPAQFHFYDDEEDLMGLDEYERKILSRPVAGNSAPLDHLDHYFDPFYNECRAYGKLVGAKLNGEVAVRCHGYMMLSSKQEDALDQKFGASDWNRPVEEYDRLPSTRPPLRAIVKDLILDDTRWTPRVANKMLRDLKKMRKLGIYVMDVKPENYKDGMLVDFSVALTNPHVVFDIKPDFQIQGYKNEDLIAFDAMMQEQKVKTTIRASRNPDTVRKLRSSRKR